MSMEDVQAYRKFMAERKGHEAEDEAEVILMKTRAEATFTEARDDTTNEEGNMLLDNIREPVAIMLGSWGMTAIALREKIEELCTVVVTIGYHLGKESQRRE